jgi:hypothetical protein
LLNSQSDRAVHEIPETTDSLWVNGVPALQLANKLATLSERQAPSTSGGVLNGTCFNRVEGTDEATTVRRTTLRLFGVVVTSSLLRSGCA